VIKGVRPLGPRLFDLMLRRFEMDPLDLYPTSEIELHLTRRLPQRAGGRSRQRLKEAG
jgi:hypothetical protein